MAIAASLQLGRNLLSSAPAPAAEDAEASEAGTLCLLRQFIGHGSDRSVLLLQQQQPWQLICEP